MDIFLLIEGLKPVEPSVLAEFRRAMNEEVIPEIVKTVRERERLARESRHWIIG